MIVDNQHLIEVTVTKSPVKLSGNIEWEVLRMTPETLLTNYILYGYNWTNLYIDPSSASFTKDTFIGSHCVVIDTYNDKTRAKVAELFNRPGSLMPTFCYPHPEKDSTKLVYCFKERLTPSVFQTVYDNVWKRAGVTQDSNHRFGNAMVQKNRGNYAPNMRCYLSNCMYSIEDFSENASENIPLF